MPLEKTQKLTPSGDTIAPKGKLCPFSAGANPQIFSLPSKRPDAPDLLAILPDGPVGGKFPHPGRIENGHPGPPGLCPLKKGLADPVLAIDIGRVVRQNQVGIMIQQGIDKRFEQVPVAAGKMPRPDAVDNAPRNSSLPS